MTVLVYPALREVDPSHWHAAHEAHSRRITPVVVLVYGLLVLASALALVVGPRSPQLWASVALVVGVIGVTAVAAAPVHGALGRGHDPALLARLTRIDLARLLLCVLALAGSVLVALGQRM